jgi:hypothetical protein
MSRGVEKARDVELSPTVYVLGRTGWICYALVHLLIAWLVVQIIIGDTGEGAGPKGAIAEISRGPLGGLMLWALAIGLFCFAVSQLLLAAMGFHWVRARPTRAARKAGAVGRGIVTIAIGVAALRMAMSGTSGPENSQQESLTAQLLALPAGRLLVGLVAIGIFVVAVATVRRGVIRSFEEDLDMASLPDGSRRWVERIGIVGWCAKGVAYGVIGILFGLAALRSDASQSGGLDKALHLLAAQWFGPALLGVVCVGFVAFAIFCFAAARAHLR